jgi:hypothetical protein
VHVPFAIVHLNVAEVPTGTPVIPDVADVGVVIVAVPIITLHVPVPVTGEFPARVKLPLLHWLMSVPAFAVVGVASFVITTSSIDAAHAPLVIVHLNVAEIPTGTPVTPDVEDVGVVIVAVPENTLHVPVPVTGEFPASVKFALLH